MLERYQLRKQFIEPEFSYRQQNVTKPSWAFKPVVVNLSLAEFPKLVTPRERYMQEYHRICQEEYSNRQKLYTDGSKRGEGVGAAVAWEGGVRMATLPREVLIFSVKLHAIAIAVQVIRQLEGERFVIMSDSCSVVSDSCSVIGTQCVEN